MQKRNVLNSPGLSELKRHRKKTFLNKILFSLLGLLVLLGFSVYLSRLNSLNIRNIEITGNKIVDTDALTQEITQEMSGKYFWLFPKTNIFLYPQNTIIKDLQNKFKRLENINLSIKNDKTLAVSVSERKALYTWCGNTPPAIVDQTTCYFIDENGYIFDQAPYFSGGVYFKFYGSTSGTDPSGSYFSKQYFKQLIYFKNILVEFGLKPVALYITPDQNVEVFLENGVSSKNEPEIIFKQNGDYENIAENLKAVLTTEPLQTEFKNKYSSLQYIDLRFGNKVYYKFQ